MKTTLIILGTICVLAAGGVATARPPGFFIQGAQLTRQADGSWTGPGTLDGVKGTLTVTGQIDVMSFVAPRKLHFTWVAGKRLVAGCSYTQWLSRPNDRQLWGGTGQITKTSKLERKYQGIHIGLNGVTNRADLQHATISVGARSPRSRNARSC
jgi:hypothetical protein